MNDRVMITGATGFIGRNLTERLVAQGATIATVTRTTSPIDAPKVSNITWTGDPVDLVRQTVEFNPDVVYHLATNFIAHHETKEIPALIDANVTFGTAVLEAARQAGARIVMTGSAWQHFEGAEYHPVSLYAATKQALLDIAVFYAAEGLDVCELTLFDTYGPGDTRKKLVPLLLDAAASGTPLEMSSGMQLIDLLYVTDAVDALIQSASQPRQGQGVQHFVARSGKAVTIRELVQIVEQAINAPIAVRWDQRENRPKEMHSDWEFGERVPGWSPVVDLLSGIGACWSARRA